MNEINHYARGDVCKILVGCKNDSAAERVVQYDTAKAFADQRRLQLIETSARDGINVDEAFMAIATEIMRQSPLPLRGHEIVIVPAGADARPLAEKTCCLFGK